MGRTVLSRIATFALGREERQRLRASQALLVALIDVFLSLICGAGAWTGLADPAPVLGWSIVTVGSALAAYAVIRSGWNERLLPSDPSLTMPQSVCSLVSVAAAYIICWQFRGVCLLAMTITLVYGMFPLKPGQVRRFAALSVLLLGGTMGAAHWRWPERFPLAQEVLHFMMIALVFPTIALLAGRLSALRQKLRTHQLELERALELNRQLAIRDELTGLYNRRHLMELMQKEVRRVQRGERPMTIALLDIDHFKRVNDTYGHARGDEVLKSFASIAGSTLRATDALGRWGGEEFMLLLPETDATQAAAMLERLHRRMVELDFDFAGSTRSVSFSAGIAGFAVGEQLQETIERADVALYRAKEGGRKRSVIAEAPPDRRVEDPPIGVG